MKRYYDVSVCCSSCCRTVSFLADSFSVSQDRILRIFSKRFGNVVVPLNRDEVLSIEETFLNDDSDDFIDLYKES